ncbi:MAG: LPXTG cell wall anchor domain-containing protein [Lactobacillus sp.]|nr:LPXTG cell wall anchor domain-containing protein [Lactobacillus sp.]
MKKWFVGCILCSSLFVGNTMLHADTQQEGSSAQTEVTVKLTEPTVPILPVPDQLPGVPGGSNTNSNITSSVNGNSNNSSNFSAVNNQVSIAKPTTSSEKNLPKTNEQNHLIYSILGGVIVGSVICFFAFRSKEERSTEE